MAIAYWNSQSNSGPNSLVGPHSLLRKHRNIIPESVFYTPIVLSLGNFHKMRSEEPSFYINAYSSCTINYTTKILLITFDIKKFEFSKVLNK